ncbi:MAG: HepT-like ribonuclease domain-containing protein [Pseudonocardiales bacterium]
MSGDRVQQRLADISEPIAANASHLGRGNISDGLIFDAVRIRLLEVGEAVKALRPDVTATEPDIPLTQIARMRDHPAHRYFDASHAVVTATVQHDLPQLAAAVARLLANPR